MPSSSRMLTLLSLLQVRRDWPGLVLAQRLEISERTVRRDVDRLRELGYRIHAIKGRDGGYRLEAGSELPPLLFDDEQAVVLAVALQTVTLAGTGFVEPAARALATVRQVMPSRLRHRIDALEVTVLNSGADAAPVSTAVLLVLGRVIRDREVLRFDYASGATPRRVEPHHLVAQAGRWYLVAWDLDRDDWRIFRVDRIAPRTPSGPHFIPRPVPGGDVGAYVSGRFKGSDGADEWPCRGEVILSTSSAEIAPYLGADMVEDLGAHRCRVFLGSWSWVALAASIGRFDAEIEVVGPPELADAFRELAERFTSVR